MLLLHRPRPVLLPVETEAFHVVGQALSRSGAGAVENRDYPLERRPVRTGSTVTPRASTAHRTLPCRMVNPMRQASRGAIQDAI